MRPRVLTLLLIPMLVAGVLVAIASIPRSTTVLGSKRWSAKYTGLDWFEGESLFGRRYYEFTIDDLPNRTWRIHYRGGEYAYAVAQYPNGKIALSGRCRIERKHFEVYPIVDDLSDAVSYSPNGTIVARVIHGRGKAILLYPNGKKNWESTYDRFHRTQWLQFDEEGNLLSSSHGLDTAPGDG